MRRRKDFFGIITILQKQDLTAGQCGLPPVSQPALSLYGQEGLFQFLPDRGDESVEVIRVNEDVAKSL
jgi:hypothetical protein